METPTPRKEGHVSLWHPWMDKPGQRHSLHLWQEFSSLPVEEIINEVGNNKYAYCQDILNPREVSTDLLLDKRTEAYLSRTGSVAALRVRRKRYSGFIIPGIQWGYTNIDQKGISAIQRVFSTFNLEAITPSSLSEKILRRTLPEKTYISRPSVMIRNSLLANRRGGRIQHVPGKWKEAYEYDANKKYLSVAAKGVPSPFVSPIRFYHSDIYQEYPVSWLECSLTAYGQGIQPIQIEDRDTGDLREPFEGESFTTWLWSGELEDCRQAGYTVHEVSQGWSWAYMSSFMAEWANILYEAYIKEDDEDVRSIMKTMMVGLPGRFLKSPEIYTLIHRSEVQKGDIPLPSQWESGDSPFSDWYMRVDSESEQARETAQLTPIGSYILSEARRDLYRDAKREENRGNGVIRLYIDSITVTLPAVTLNQGTGKGQYKGKCYSKVRIRHNRFYGVLVDGSPVLKAPGFTGEAREREKGILQWENSS